MKKTLSYLGFAKKSGSLVAGMGTCELYMKKGKVKFLIIAEDTAKGSMEKAVAMAKRWEVPYVIYGDSFDMASITGEGGAKTVFGITDENFGKTIASSIEKELQETGKEI